MINNVEVLIKGIGKLELDTQLSEEFGISIVYSIDDISNFGSRKSTYSKTIKVPGTKNNNKLLGQLYDIKIDGSFDMTLKHDCVLTVNNNSIIDGFLVLNSIDKYMIGDKFQIFYELNIFDEVKNLFDDLGEYKLSDLDFSSGFTFGTSTWGIGDHIFNENNVVSANINTGTTLPYFYPLTNYGYYINKINKNYPLHGTSLGLIYPSVYFKAIFDKIFYDNGYTYTSDFLNGNSYDSLFTKFATIYNKGSKWTEARYCNYVCSGQTITNYMSDIDSSKQIYYDRVNGIFNTKQINYYECDDYYFDGKLIVSGATVNTSIRGLRIPIDLIYKINMKFDIQSDYGETNGNGRESDYLLYHYRFIEGTEELLGWYKTEQMGGPGPNYCFTTGLTYLELKKDDIIYMTVRPGEQNNDGPMGSPGEPIDVTIRSASIELQECWSGQTTSIDKYNTTIDLASTLPDMTQADFLREIIKIGNLYIKPSKINNKNLIIEPRDDFYDGSMVDWSDKVDYNKSINAKNLNDKNYAIINLTYTEGEDYYNKLYQANYNKIYGSKKIQSTNTLFNDENTLELLFQSYSMYNWWGFSDTLISIITETEKSTWFDDRKDWNSMFGILTINVDNTILIPFANFDSGYTGIDFRYNQFLYLDGTPGFITVQHATELGGKEYDVNFETTNPLYNTILQSPDNNLYTLFYKNQIDNIQHKNCRYVTMYLDLKLSDILNLSFRNTITIDGQMYLLQKIEYDVTKQVSSKVELLKLVTPYNSGVPGQYNLMSIKYLPGNDDYFLTDDTDRIRIN